MILPLAIGISLTLMLVGHWEHKTSEQTRLDALTLSLCHHRKNYLGSEILALNSEVKAIQLAMDLKSATCFAAVVATGGTGALAVCDTIRADLQIMSNSGRGLETNQDVQRSRYSEEKNKLIADLQKKNNLITNYGELKTLQSGPLIDDGLMRENLTGMRLTLQNILGIQWPRKLVLNEGFSLMNLYSYEFYPHRYLIGTNLKPKPWSGFNIHQVKNLKTDAAVTRSACDIKAISENHFQVRRLK